jgi:hypothetical protein
MPNHSRFVIENNLSGPVILNIEPEGAHIPLASGETVTVQDTFEKEPVTLKIESDRGDTFISVWPGDGAVRVEKDGVDVFDIVQKAAGVVKDGKSGGRGMPRSRTQKHGNR